LQYNNTTAPQKQLGDVEQLPHLPGMMIALLFIITAVCAVQGLSAAVSTAYTNGQISHLSNSPRHTNSNKPQRFLRWRATLESPILTNEDDNKDGTYLKFNNINLRLYPVNLPSFEGQIGSSIYETYNNNDEMDGIIRVLQSVLESHINSTLHESMILESEEDITEGSAAYVKLGNVKLVSTSYTNNNDLATNESEPVRRLKETTLSSSHKTRASESFAEPVRSLTEERELQSSREGIITIQIQGGEIYYKYGLGGELLSMLPTEVELSSLLIDSLELDNGDDNGQVGGVLASTLQSMQPTESLSFTTSQVDNLGEDSANYEDLFFGMFDDVMTVESVPAVTTTGEPIRFPTTSMPTDEPTFKPITNAPTDQPSMRPVTESPISNAPVATPTTYSPITTSPTTLIPTEVSVPTVPAEEIPTPELPTTTFLPTEDVGSNANTDNNKVEPITGQDLVAVITEANSAASSKPDDDEGKNTTIILAASISGLVVVFAILALFVYKRRRSTSGSSLPLSSRSDDDDDGGNGVVMKAIPLSNTIGSDDFNSSGEEGGLFDNSRGEKKEENERDLEIGGGQRGEGNNGQESSSAPRSQHSSASKSNVQPPSQVSTQHKAQVQEDEAYDKMLANAMVAGISKKRGSVQLANKSLLSSDTFAKAMPLPMDTNGDEEEEEEDTLDALAKGQPLGRHDSLTGAVQLTRDISDFDVLAGAAAAKEELVFDDIDEAMKLADIHINTVARNIDSTDDDEIAGEIRDDTNNKFVGSQRPQSCPPPVSTENSRPPMAPPSAMHHHSRPTTPSMMTRQDSFASRDILNDINAAAEKRRQIERQNGRSTPTDLLRALTPANDVPKKEDINMIDAEPDANHDDIKSDEPQKEPEEDNFSNDILDTISQVVRAKETSTLGVPLTSAKQGSAEPTNIVSPSALPERKRSSDPPGIITLEQNQDDLTLFTEMESPEKPTLARRAACGISNTLSNMVCKEGNGRQTPTKVMTMKWNPTLSNNHAPHYISDDDSSDEGDIISKPWMEKWKTDEFKEQTLVSPPVSNYDPDSEWDVSDAEVEEGTKEDDMRIW